ncbi:hypothetical protein Ctob_016295 [Chrysochromulina tobinii]|uniref:Uncharacterized protein n=1 Tax=Chrysochromulina tobinii TaxID=1460289 RepID=A0A0M0K8S3_9EUKA|nr:hypothetical protein Ctob_016295 [Chrysochromulina tobinii]|eukprot:KOO35261.1 hypothetical protein Ctob_016295 [Chrysochromulina sp. CCMP291]
MSKPSSLPIVGAALAQKKKRDTIALIEKLDTMQITAQWINEEFLSARLKLSSQQKTKKTKKTNIFFCWLSACCEEPKSDESPSEQDKQQRIEELSENVYERLTTQKNEELSKKLYERLTDHAIYSHKQLEDVAMQKGGVALLHEILHCKGAAEAISEYYDNLLALQESLAPKLDLVDMLFSWAFTG